MPEPSPHDIDQRLRQAMPPVYPKAPEPPRLGLFCLRLLLTLTLFGILLLIILFAQHGYTPTVNQLRRDMISSSALKDEIASIICYTERANRDLEFYPEGVAI